MRPEQLQKADTVPFQLKNPLALDYLTLRVIPSPQRDAPPTVLELQETYHLTSGETVQFSTDIFAPGALDLHVIRWIEAAMPAQVNSVGKNGRDGQRRGRRKRA